MGEQVQGGTLRFKATQAEPNFAGHFLAGGGVLGSAAGAGKSVLLRQLLMTATPLKPILFLPAVKVLLMA